MEFSVEAADDDVEPLSYARYAGLLLLSNATRFLIDNLTKGIRTIRLVVADWRTSAEMTLAIDTVPRGPEKSSFLFFLCQGGCGRDGGGRGRILALQPEGNSGGGVVKGKPPPRAHFRDLRYRPRFQSAHLISPAPPPLPPRFPRQGRPRPAPSSRRFSLTRESM